MNPLTVVTGSIVKKYRLTNRLRSELGVSRQCAVPMQMKHLAVEKKSRLLESRNHLRQHITNFLELDENSTCLPSKRDAQKVDDEKVQKRVLNDYMHNLHMKYLAQNPDKKVSRSFFYTCRKANYVCASFGVRQTCLCLRRQNMSLKLQALKLLGVATLTNADAYIQANTDESTIERLVDAPDADIVKYSEWKRVDVTYIDKTTKRMQIGQCEMERPKFVQLIRL